MFGVVFNFFKNTINWLSSLFQNRDEQTQVQAQPEPVSILTSKEPTKVYSKDWYHDTRIDEYAEKICPNAPFENQISVKSNSCCTSESFKLFVQNPSNDLNRVNRERKKYQNKTQIIFPLNSGNHYELFVLDRESKSVYHMDSLNYPMNQEWANLISNYAKIIWTEEENTLFAIEKIQMPHQGNGVDCGPAVCQFIHHIATKGLKDLLEWAKQHEVYDYSQFREEVDAQLGMHIPLRFLLSATVEIKSSSESNDSDLEIVDDKSASKRQRVLN
jgi:hypothetical protein